MLSKSRLGSKIRQPMASLYHNSCEAWHMLCIFCSVGNPPCLHLQVFQNSITTPRPEVLLIDQLDKLAKTEPTRFKKNKFLASSKHWNKELLQVMKYEALTPKITDANRPITWNDTADVVHKVQVSCACVSSPHGFQHGVTATLGWEVELPTDVGPLLDQSQNLQAKTRIHLDKHQMLSLLPVSL